MTTVLRVGLALDVLTSHLLVVTIVAQARNVKKAEDPLCHDCGKGIKEGAPRYKKECVHLECGSLRGSATRTLDQDDPSGDMTRHLLKVRRTDPKSYQEILSALGERGSTGRLTVLQKKLLIDATKTHARIRQMRNTEGLLMLDIDEYCHHWKHVRDGSASMQRRCSRRIVRRMVRLSLPNRT